MSSPMICKLRQRPTQHSRLALCAQAFFLTAKVLHLGPVHVLAFRNQLAKQVQRLEEDAKQLEHMLPGYDSVYLLPSSNRFC